ncbi:SurA N-terminal domain-containing protein [Streptomyces sp. PU-14G]|uniref:SurA N-terminal domain-containing protein n=1 Tax=Streptomyces sp. PU-14G TaxID=2800808 RepID=UPI0034DF81EC
MESPRRRSALTLSAVAALLAATPLLTACGNDAHPGAAALVKGDRISMAQLQARVGAVRDAQRAEPQGEQMIKQSGKLTRATLDGMIRERVVAQAAKDAGAGVSRREVQQVRGELEKQAGGKKQLETVWLRQHHLAPDDIDDFIRMQLRIEKIAAAKGIDLMSPEGPQRINAQLSRVADDMKINVNPRYGEWNTRTSSLGGDRAPWLRELSGEADRAQGA